MDNTRVNFRLFTANGNGADIALEIGTHLFMDAISMVAGDSACG